MITSLRHRLPIVALLSLSPAFAQQYNSNDITPPGVASGKLTGTSGGKQVGGSSNGHALLENNNALTSVDLHPAGYISSMALSSDDLDQCGYANSGFGPKASKWSGSAASFVDLSSNTPATYSYCTGNHGGQFVGYGERPVYFTTFQDAFLWQGGTVTTLTPAPGFSYGKAMGVRFGQQVGYGSTVPYPAGDVTSYHPASHAMLWTGTAASVIDLNPANFIASEALATNGTQQGGWAYTTTQHAMLWSGTPDSAVDLHPAGYWDSRITALTADKQVGDAWTGPMGQPGSVRHAIVWSGTAASAIDLNQFLPPGYLHAAATGIDANGNVVGFAYNTPGTGGFAIPPDAIAVVFAPSQPGSVTISSLSLSPSSPAPGSAATGTVTLAGPAPAAGVSISFTAVDASILPAPAPLTIPAGQSSATFPVTIAGAALQVPTTIKLYASDGAISRSATVVVTPVVNPSSLNVNPVEGGFTTIATLTLTVPAQTGGASVALASSNPALVTLPATVTVPQGQNNVALTVITAPVTATTTVPVTASFNGVTVNGTATLSPAPVVAVSGVVVPTVIVGGQGAVGTLVVTNYPRNAGGVNITLSSGDAKTLQVPATVNIPQGATSATFAITTIVVTGSKGVAIKAALGASNSTGNTAVIPIPTITMVQADYLTDLHMLKVAATSASTGAVFTFGTDPLGPALGIMQLELGQYKGATVVATAPTIATVWSSDGGMATMTVTQKLSTSGGGGATGGGGTGGGGGGGGSTATYKISISKAGKGTVSTSPSAASYAPGTVVTLTAIPDAGSTWFGWGGACSGTATTCTLTMNSDKAVTAAFK